MKVILTMAMSINGMIADENGSEDFLSHDNWIAFVKLANKVANFVYGRKTYEAVLEWSQKYFEDLDKVVMVVISQDKSLDVQKGFVQVDTPKLAVDFLSEKGFTEVLVAGGNSVYSSFLKEDLADEIIAFVNPIVLARGVPVFGSDIPEAKLELLSADAIGKGIVELHYKVIR